jgi:organic hydroperoxide reductase OsmC/OhrA
MKATQEHPYVSRIEWTGNRGQGTESYKGYDRTWDINTAEKPVINCSNAPLLGGDVHKPNPEDLLISSLSACHMLWYLHLASKAGIVIHSYIDEPIGIGETASNGAGRFLRATLRPQITVGVGANIERATALHDEVNQYCFIARSVNFPVSFEPSFIVANELSSGT